MRRPGILLFMILSVVFMPVAALTKAEDAGISRERRVVGTDKVYTDTVEESPVDLKVLEGRAKSLKTKGRYLEASRLLKRAAGVAGAGERARLTIEAATLFAWAKEYVESVTLFREVLTEDPGNRRARLGLARTLGWAGRYDEAMDEYGKILSKDDADTEARIGLARVLAWKGDYDASIGEYRTVLERDPADSEALLGLARTLWWKGDIKGALANVDRLTALDPDNTEVRIFRKRLRVARGPNVAFHYTDSNDSDSNDLRVYKTHGYAAYGPGLRFDLDYSLFEASRFDDRARAKVLTGAVSYKLSKITTLKARLAHVSIDAPSNPTSHMAGGVSARRVLNKRLRVGASFNHSPLLDTAQLIRNNIRVDNFSVHLVYNAPFATLGAGASYGDYSDGNSRHGFFLDINRVIERFGKNPLLTAGYRLEYRDFSKDLNSGYFDPTNFISNTVYAELRGGLYNGRVEFTAEAEAGLQHYNSKSEFTSRFYIQAVAHITGHISADLSYKYSKSALESTAGFRYEEYKLGVNYLF